MTIQLLRFNTYYNRTYKQLPADYSDLIIHEQPNVNFNPNDGVNTIITLNLPSVSEDEANYAVLLNNNEIESRWFIIDARRTRLNQYELTLRRDLLGDYFNDITNAPTFIEKATVQYGNPLLFNSEDMTFNQIKQSEMLLRDETLCPWIVGYIKQGTESRVIEQSISSEYYNEYVSWDDVPFGDNITNRQFKGNLNVSNLEVIYLYDKNILGRAFNTKVIFNSTGNVSYSNFEEVVGSYNTIRASNAMKELSQNGAASRIGRDLSNYYGLHTDAFNSAINTEYGIETSASTAAFLNTYSEEGTIIKVGATLYRITRSGKPVSEQLRPNPISGTSPTYDVFMAMVNSTDKLVVDGVPTARSFATNLSYTDYTITAEVITDYSGFTTTIPGSSRNHLQDAPYDMFAIPYNVNTTLKAGTTLGAPEIANCNATAGLLMAMKMSAELTDNFIDLQLLPYCPIPDISRYSPGQLNLRSDRYTPNVDYSYIYDTTTDHNPVSVILWCKSSSFSTIIDRTFKSVGNLLVASDINVEVKEAKVEAMCDMYRLTSPNYNGQFEFNAVKNNGIRYFTVDATYKPYNPYIRVAPNFGGLYGSEFGDARGLICGGDFSLATITDKWEQYELNNKNYLNAFNRQIENMEVNNKYQRMSEVAGAMAGAVSGAASGATFGMVAGGGVGAVVGGVAGGAISGVGGITDVAINDKLRSEALDFTKDQFGYQLGNIRALPYTLNRVSSFNINNKVFPMLEYYTCSDTEKEALRNKMKYNGMTVMTIGTVQEYIIPDTASYIKGRLIRLEGFDNHITNEIANELNKGFYI